MAKVLQMLFNLDVAVTGLKGLQAIEQQFGKVSEAGKKMSSLQSQMGAFQAQQAAVSGAASKLETLRQKLDTARLATQNARLASQTLNVQYAQAQNKVAALTAQFGRKSLQVKQARQDMLKLKQAYQQSEAEVRRLSREEQNLEGQVKRAGDALSSERDKLKQMQEGLKQAGINTRNFAQRQKELENAMARVAKANERYNNIKSQLSYSNFKSDLLKSAGLAFTLKAPVTASMKFEQAIMDVAAVARPTAEELSRLREQAKFLGRTTQFTAVQAADAQQNLIRSGMTVDQVIKAMPSVLELSSAEGLNIEDAGRIIAKSLGGMNLGGEMATRLADVLSYASAHSNTDVTMLGEAFKVAAPALASQGYSMEQVASYLGIMANKGYEGSEAGNALSSSIMRLAVGPKSTVEALAKLGVKRRDKDNNGIPLPELIMKIWSRLKNESENVQLEYMSNIFGKNYGKQMIAFMQATASGQTKTLENGVWNESFGWAKQSTGIRLNTLNGDIVALGSAWDGLMTRIGESLSPMARQLTQALTDAINWVTQLIDKLGPLGDIIIQIAGGFAAWKIISIVYKYASLLVQLPFAKMGVHLAETAAQAAIAGTSMSGVAAAAQAAGTASSMLGSIWTTIAGPLGVLVTLAAALYMNWEKVSEWATKAGQAIQNIDRTTPTSKLKPATPDYHIRQMESAFGLPPEIAHAEGGILTQPHIGLVAEAGPEAIIPLSKPSLGVPLLERAASILGMKVSNTTAEKTKIRSNRSSSVLSFSDFSEVIPHAFGGIFGLTLPKNSDPLNRNSDTIPDGMRRISPRNGSIVSNLATSFRNGNFSSTLSSIFGGGSLSQTVQQVLANPGQVLENVSSSITNHIQGAKDWVSNAVTQARSFDPQSIVSQAANFASQSLSSLRNVLSSEDSYSIKRAGDSFGLRSGNSNWVRNSSGASSVVRQAPVINITVNGASSPDPRSLADDIAAKVREVLNEISSMEERSSFA